MVKLLLDRGIRIRILREDHKNTIWVSFGFFMIPSHICYLCPYAPIRASSWNRVILLLWWGLWKIVTAGENLLFWWRELTPEQIYATAITAPAPCMSTSRKRAVGTCYSTPLIFVYEIYEEVVEEAGKGPIIVLAPKQEQLLVAWGWANESRGWARWRRFTRWLRNLQKLGLLYTRVSTSILWPA